LAFGEVGEKKLRQRLGWQNGTCSIEDQWKGQRILSIVFKKLEDNFTANEKFNLNLYRVLERYMSFSLNFA
jgi:hypothetical protein